MLFFKSLTALLVPLAASAMPTGGNFKEHNGLNPNNTTAFITTASNWNRDNTAVITRQFDSSTLPGAPCDCNDPNCANLCQLGCTDVNGNDDLQCLIACCSNINPALFEPGGVLFPFVENF
ncbi:hypothetical protein BGW80DRAFT_1446862 [Lactifluus volemus]|nr:hypothetical protein BGW80DRAFT_1446862 [Lactifluus volemus]